MNNLRLLAFLTLVLSFFASPIQAEEEQTKDIALEKQKASIVELHKKIATLAKDLESEQKGHFALIYNNFNIIGTVEMVRGDITKAVDGCVKNNPDLKEKMEKNYQTWTDGVDPVLKEARAHLDNMVLAQDYAEKMDIEEVFKAIDESRENESSRIEKIPVTTHDACEYLMGKMDETQQNMENLLRSTLISFPQTFQESFDEAAAKEGHDEKGNIEEEEGDHEH